MFCSRSKCHRKVKLRGCIGGREEEESGEGKEKGRNIDGGGVWGVVSDVFLPCLRTTC